MTDRPPDSIIEAARQIAMTSPCAKSRRGVVIYHREDVERNVRMFSVSRGTNSPPTGFTCTGSEACRRDCAKLCVHAEEQAIINAQLARVTRGMPHLDLVHVKVIGDAIVAGGGPSCWQCSRLIAQANIGGVWLLEAAPDGARLDSRGRWRRYTATEFHHQTLRACDLGDQE